MTSHFQRLGHYFSGYDGALSRRFDLTGAGVLIAQGRRIGTGRESPACLPIQRYLDYILRLVDPGVHCTNSIISGVLESHHFSLPPFS